MNDILASLGITQDKVAVVLVDHGSRRDESNSLLLDVVEAFHKQNLWAIVEPAHMELAEPSIATAFDRCVAQGAEFVIVFPYFLAPGRHWNEDIPRLAAEAAGSHPGLRHLVTNPLGLHPLLIQVINERIAAACMAHISGDTTSLGPHGDSNDCTPSSLS